MASPAVDAAEDALKAAWDRVEATMNAAKKETWHKALKRWHLIKGLEENADRLLRYNGTEIAEAHHAALSKREKEAREKRDAAFKEAWESAPQNLRDAYERAMDALVEAYSHIP